MSDFFSYDYSLMPTNVPMLLLAVLLAFLGGHLIAWVYMLTHSGLSYSKSFVNSLIVIPVVVALVMLVLSNNLVTVFGMMAVFAIVRFRNILRDTLDTGYILCVIVVGMAAGTMKFATAIVGCLVICGVMLYLWFTGFGARHRYDIILNLHWSRPLGELSELRERLHRHSVKALCTGQRTSHGEHPGTDLSYRLLMRDPERMEDLATELRAMQGVTRVTVLKAEDESEI
jgi:hypothetical protein